MADSKEEKAARLASEAEVSTAAQLPADDVNKQNEGAADPKAVEAIDGDGAESAPSHLVEVVLHEDNPASILTNVHTIFHAMGSTEFVDGKAHVNPDVAAHLKESKQVK